MSLKVPKAGGPDLFKAGYKVSLPLPSIPNQQGSILPSGQASINFFQVRDAGLTVQHMSGLEEAVLRNIAAVGELSEIVRTSFGPNG
mgnify:FL=1|jgi:T-complex protein 1 subunit theta